MLKKNLTQTTSKQTVLIVSPVGTIGGAETNLLLICDSYIDRGFTPIVIMPNEEPLLSTLRSRQIECIIIPKYFLQSGQIFNVLFGCLLLWIKLFRTRFSLIHINSIFCLYLPIYFGFFKKVKCLIHWADFDTRKGDIQVVNIFKHTHVIAVSKSIKETLINNQLNPQKVDVIYNGITHKTPSCKATDIYQNIPFNDTDFIIGITGRIDSWKGHKTLLNALHKTNPKIKLLILGSFHTIKNTELEPELKTLIQTLNLGDRVHFTGFVDSPENYVQIMDIVCIPSEYEPFGLVAIEAMSLQKAVIASNVGGLAEIIAHNQTGILIDPTDTDQWARTIEALYTDTNKRNRLAKNGFESYGKTFTQDRFSDNYFQLVQHHLN